MHCNKNTNILQEDDKSLPQQLLLQEELYTFPYHHIPTWSDTDFSHYRVLQHSYEYASYCRYVIKRLADRNFNTLLDVGCGDGKFCKEVYAKYKHAKVTGVDISDRAVGFASYLVPECSFVAGDITDEMVVTGSYDVVTLIEVLEHILPNSVDSFLSGISDRIATNGRLIVSVPSCNVEVTERHFQHFDENSLQFALENYFVIDELIYLNRKNWWEAIYCQLMCNKIFILRNSWALEKLFRIYEKFSLIATKSNCRRLVAICSCRSDGSINDSRGND